VGTPCRHGHVDGAMHIPCYQCRSEYWEARTKEAEKGHAEAIEEWARMEGLLKAFLHKVESVAFAQPSEQLQTLWGACQYVRKELKEGTISADDPRAV